MKKSLTLFTISALYLQSTYGAEGSNEKQDNTKTLETENVTSAVQVTPSNPSSELTSDMSMAQLLAELNRIKAENATLKAQQAVVQKETIKNQIDGQLQSAKLPENSSNPLITIQEMKLDILVRGFKEDFVQIIPIKETLENQISYQLLAKYVTELQNLWNTYEVLLNGIKEHYHGLLVNENVVPGLIQVNAQDYKYEDHTYKTVAKKDQQSRQDLSKNLIDTLNKNQAGALEKEHLSFNFSITADIKEQDAITLKEFLEYWLVKSKMAHEFLHAFVIEGADQRSKDFTEQYEKEVGRVVKNINNETEKAIQKVGRETQRLFSKIKF